MYMINVDCGHPNILGLHHRKHPLYRLVEAIAEKEPHHF
jgi:hypothetical protein